MKDLLFVLVHSPLVDSGTWEPVAGELAGRGIAAVVAKLVDRDESGLPFWKQHAQAAAAVIRSLPENLSPVLVGHSGAGPLLPAIRAAASRPVRCYLFVDAGLPRNGASRLDLMREEDSQWADRLVQFLDGGGTFPAWSAADLAPIIPDAGRRTALLNGLQPRGRPFFEEPISVFPEWPDAPCAVIRWSAAYTPAAAEARRRGWPALDRPAGHFHMLVEPGEVCDQLLTLTGLCNEAAPDDPITEDLKPPGQSS